MQAAMHRVSIAGPRVAAIHRFFVRARFHALAIAAALGLVEQHDAVFRTFVDGLAGTRRETGRIRAVIADARKVEEPGVVRWQLFTGRVELVAHARLALGIVLVDVRQVPFLVGRKIAEDTRAVWRHRPVGRFEDGLAAEPSVGGRSGASRRAAP
jgi:hypothetical protein